jgi:hypothetical protein
MPTAADSKDEGVAFIKGKHIGYTGWINIAGDETAKSRPVIVKNWKELDGSTVDRVTNVRRSCMCEGPAPQPTTRAEVIMCQMPTIEAAMDSLCQQLVKCELSHDSRSIHAIFESKLQEATANQIAQGGKATWHCSQCRPSDMHEE